MNQANPLPAELSAQLSALSPTQLAWLSGYCWAQSQGAAAPLPEVSAVRPAPAARRVTVLSASQTGNARRVAEQLHAGLKAAGVEARLTTHKPMLDAGRLQDGEPFLAATALRPIARVGTDLAQRLSLRSGEEVTVSTTTGSITLPAVVGGVSDGTVWLPECSAGSTVHQTLGAGHGSQVTLTHAAEVLR